MQTRQEKLLASAIDALYSCALEEAAWPEALLAMGRFFDSPRVGLLRTTASLDRVLDMKGLNFEPEVQSQYNRYYWQLDPTLEAGRRVRPGEWQDCSRLFDPSTTPHREYVHDFALPSGLRWVAGGKVHGDPDGCIMLGLQRPADARPFDSDCALLFDRLRPHLRRTCLIAQELQTARGRLAMSTASMNELQQAAFVVSRSAQLLLANQAAEALLRTRIPLAASDGRLQASASGNASRLEAAIRAATAPGHRSASGWSERAADGRHWILRVVPMDQDIGSALVYVSSTKGGLAASTLLERIFSLTAAEAEIAHQLAQGLTVKEVAFARGVSALTVRAQVRAVIDKTGARRLSGLQALVRSVPPLTRDER